jgi:hypothetical protein
MDTAWHRATIADGHAQGIQAKLGIDIAGYRVAHYLSRKYIHDDGQIDKTDQDMDVGYIGYPNLIDGFEVYVLYQVWINPVWVVAVGGTYPIPFSFRATKAIFAHDTGDFFMVYGHAFPLQLLGYPTVSVVRVLQTEIGDMGNKHRF